APPPSSHSDTRAQNSSMVIKKATSLARADIRKAIGNGTTMGWIGWLPRATAVGEPGDGSGIGCRDGVVMKRAFSFAQPAAQQPACRGRLAVSLSCVPVLAACADTPLSAIDPASEGARHIANVWFVMAWGSAIILLIMVLLA